MAMRTKAAAMRQCSESYPIQPIQFFWDGLLEPIREVCIHAEGFVASRRSMMRIMAMRTKAAAIRQCRSKPRARQRSRLGAAPNSTGQAAQP